MKKNILMIIVVLATFVTHNALAQRPESFYVRKALGIQGGQQSTGKPMLHSGSVGVSKQKRSCPSCSTINFNNYSPDKQYISVYGADSVWVHTYDETTPDPVYSGGFLNFSEGCLSFTHYADNSWAPNSYWDGFTVSKTSSFPCDTTCSDPCNGLESQFSSITGGGVSGATDPYGVAFYGYNASYFPVNHCKITLESAKTLCGLYVTNNAYAYKSIRCGDDFADPFALGDYLKLVIKGYNGSTLTGTVNYYLADFRGPTNAYIVDAWKWVNLSSLGSVTSLMFEIVTTDMGIYGPNTPMYFCLDGIKVGTTGCGTCNATDNNHNWFPIEGGGLRNDNSGYDSGDSGFTFSVSPNPATSSIILYAPKGSGYEIIDMNGKVRSSGIIASDKEMISVEALQSGLYTIKVHYQNKIKTEKLLKE